VHNGPFLKVFLRTVGLRRRGDGALDSAIGYPVAYYAARPRPGAGAGSWLLLLVLPFWINYLMRMLAWINLLSPRRLGARASCHDFGIEALFEKIGLPQPGWRLAQRPGPPRSWIAPRLRLHPVPDPAVVCRPRPHRPAPYRGGGATLGASPFAAFRRVTLPALGAPASLAGTVLIALPMFGDYYTNDLISASPRTSMIGNQIDEYARQGSPEGRSAPCSRSCSPPCCSC